MSDKILWRQLKEGNHKALETVYRTHFSHLINYGKRFSNDSATVEDAIQELFIELWNKRESLGETDAIKPYLLVSLRRKIFRSVKQIQKTVNDNEPTDYHFDAVLAIDEDIIGREIAIEQKQKLADAMKKLSHRQREVLYLKYQSNMDYEGISEAMDINYQSARNLVSKAIAALSKHLIIVSMIILLGQ